MVQHPKLPFAALHGDPDILADGCTRFGPTALVLPKLERYTGGTYLDFWQTLQFDGKVAKKTKEFEELLKNENTYELFNPKELGRNRQFIIGKHTGIAGIINKFNELGKHIDNDTAKKIILKIRNELEVNKNFDINNYLIKYANSNKQEVFYDD